MSEPNVISSGRGPEHIAVLLGRLRLAWLLDHFPPRVVWALYIFINGFLTIALLALLAVVTGSPFVFPSLGPTAYLLFIAPLQQNSSPRNTILGHALGLACGYGAYIVTGAASVPYGLHPGVYWPRILSAALSLSATGAFMDLLRADRRRCSLRVAGAIGFVDDQNQILNLLANSLNQRQLFARNRRVGSDHNQGCINVRNECLRGSRISGEDRAQTRRVNKTHTGGQQRAGYEYFCAVYLFPVFGVPFLSYVFV